MYQVVIVEDEFFVRLGIKNSVAWEENDMQVVYDTGNGADAWEFIRHNRPDILITDILMPDMDGEQLIENIYKSHLNTYVIVITCLEEFRMVQKMMSLGVRDYLLKATMTEQEIQDSIIKAKKELDKKAIAAPRRTTRRQMLAPLIRSWLADSTQYDQVCQAFENQELSTESCMTAVLGVIDSVNEQNRQSAGVSGGNLCQNLIDLLEHQQLSGFRSIALALDSQRFLMLLFSETPAENTADRLTRLQTEVSDYLNIRFSLFYEENKKLPDLPESYERLTGILNRHYLHGSGCLLALENYQEPVIPKVCAPLSQFRDWFGEVCGAGAAVRFQNCINSIETHAAKSQEEMIYALLNLSHLIGSFFDQSLEKDRRQCECSIINVPFLEDAVAALELFLSACRQHLQMTQMRYRPEIRAILSYIHENLSDPDLTLNSVAKHVGLSETYLSSLFHAEVKQPFRKYLTHARIETAKYLLENTDEKIGSIAIKTGFSDEGYFSKVFKKVTNLSPKDWRNL